MFEPVEYSLRLRGEAVPLGDGRLWSECRGYDDASHGRDVVCRRELELHDGTLVSSGEISFGEGGSLTFEADGRIVDTPSPGVRHGTAVCTVTGGSGRFAEATGSIVSQFLLTDGGELTEQQLALIFVRRDG